jgi:hypothetical protein
MHLGKGFYKIHRHIRPDGGGHAEWLQQTGRLEMLSFISLTD